MSRPTPPDSLRHAVDAYLAGKGCDRAAERFHVSPVVLRRELQQRGVWRTIEQARALAGQRRRVDSLPDAAALAEEYRTVSEKELAARYGVDRRTIRKRLLEAGVEPRDISAAHLLRYSTMSPEERRLLVMGAHEAKRGQPNSFDSRVTAAQTRQARRSTQSPDERQLALWLTERGLETIPQQQVGSYNVDLGAFPVAVEVHGGGWHMAAGRRVTDVERAKYLLDRGWSLVVIWVNQNRYPIGVGAADYVVAFRQEFSGDEPLRRQYRVIRGTGQELARGEGQLDEWSLIPPSGRRRRAHT